MKSFLFLNLFLITVGAKACPDLSGFFIKSDEGGRSASIAISQRTVGDLTSYGIMVDGSLVMFELRGNSAQKSEKFKDEDGNMYSVLETLTCTPKGEFINEVFEKTTTVDGKVLFESQSSYQFSLDTNRHLRFVTDVLIVGGRHQHMDSVYLRQESYENF